jgi:hypothetical protein
MESYLPKKRSDLEIREVEDELLVLDRRGGRIHKFNHSAAGIFHCCDGRHTIDKIIDQVVEMYGAPFEVVEHDVANAVTSFRELGLLEEARGTRS